jgi:hypothetical protein
MLAYLREIFSLEEVGDLEVVGNTVVLGIASCHQTKPSYLRCSKNNSQLKIVQNFHGCPLNRYAFTRK